MKETYLSRKIILRLTKRIIKNHPINAYRYAIIFFISLLWWEQLLVIEKLFRPSHISSMKDHLRSGLKQKHNRPRTMIRIKKSYIHTIFLASNISWYPMQLQQLKGLNFVLQEWILRNKKASSHLTSVYDTTIPICMQAS